MSDPVTGGKDGGVTVYTTGTADWSRDWRKVGSVTVYRYSWVTSWLWDMMAEWRFTGTADWPSDWGERWQSDISAGTTNDSQWLGGGGEGGRGDDDRMASPQVQAVTISVPGSKVQQYELSSCTQVMSLPTVVFWHNKAKSNFPLVEWWLFPCCTAVMLGIPWCNNKFEVWNQEFICCQQCALSVCKCVYMCWERRMLQMVMRIEFEPTWNWQ